MGPMGGSVTIQGSSPRLSKSPTKQSATSGEGELGQWRHITSGMLILRTSIFYFLGVRRPQFGIESICWFVLMTRSMRRSTTSVGGEVREPIQSINISERNEGSNQVLRGRRISDNHDELAQPKITHNALGIGSLCEGLGSIASQPVVWLPPILRDANIWAEPSLDPLFIGTSLADTTILHWLLLRALVSLPRIMHVANA
mmetsp:Transcript_48480/g.128251  ORF Transcript_48480/g.128251 Transcript_48480/m.128251 type:complete len:200 (+) Transcript_48480:150-749(+)